MTYAQIVKEGELVICAALTIDGMKVEKRVKSDEAQRLWESISHEHGIGKGYDAGDVICKNDDGETRIPPGETDKCLVNGVSYMINHWSKEREEKYKKEVGFGHPPGTTD